MRRSRGIPAEELAGELAALRAEVTRTINNYLGVHGLTQSELAERMGVTAGRVSQILAGDENLTLRTLATVAAAVGAHFEVALRRDDEPEDESGHPGWVLAEETQPAAAGLDRNGWPMYEAVGGNFRPEVHVAESRYVESLQVGRM
jgi:transcriptional regulator with XRE-family HTH domain